MAQAPVQSSSIAQAPVQPLKKAQAPVQHSKMAQSSIESSIMAQASIQPSQKPQAQIQPSKMSQASVQLGFSFQEKKGDLFDCPETDSLVHCVSEDLRMGKGIAVIFKKKFGGIGELASQGKKTGQVAVLKKKGRFIYYLITKPKGSGKPSYASIKASLLDLKKHCLDNDVHQLSMPRIGCGLDRLDWGKISDMIQEIFADTKIQITVYYMK